MKNYNFDKQDNDFGATRRIDAVQKQVRVLKKRSNIEPKVFGMNKAVAILIIILCVLFIMLSCFAISKMINTSAPKNEYTDQTHIDNPNNLTDTNNNSIQNNNNKTNTISCGIIEIKNTANMRVKDCYSQNKFDISISSSTPVIGKDNNKMSIFDISAGDLISVKYSESGYAEEITFPENSFSYKDITGIDIDIDSKKINYNNQLFEYNDNTLFHYKSSNIYPGDIDKYDIVTICGVGSTVFGFRVEKSHGYIVIKNADTVENISIEIDGEKIEDIEDFIIPLLEGEHSISINGDNIEQYETQINITALKNTELDILNMIGDTKIILNVNADTYQVFLNGIEYPENTTEIAVNKGIYQVLIKSSGYKDFYVMANCTKQDANLKIELEKERTHTVNNNNINNNTNKNTDNNNNSDNNTSSNINYGSLTVYTNPSWLKVYIDGEYKGVSPIMARLEYGEHNISAEDSSGNVKEQNVLIDGPDKRVNIDF